MSHYLDNFERNVKYLYSKTDSEQISVYIV